MSKSTAILDGLGAVSSWDYPAPEPSSGQQSSPAMAIPNNRRDEVVVSWGPDGRVDTNVARTNKRRIQSKDEELLGEYWRPPAHLPPKIPKWEHLHPPSVPPRDFESEYLSLFWQSDCTETAWFQRAGARYGESASAVSANPATLRLQ